MISDVPVTFWKASRNTKATEPEALAEFSRQIDLRSGSVGICLPVARQKTVCRIVVANSRETKSDEFDFNIILIGANSEPKWVGRPCGVPVLSNAIQTCGRASTSIPPRN